MNGAVDSGWRLLIDSAQDGAWNMAVDEAIVERQLSHPRLPPTLRLYGWSPAALSLGRGQAAPDREVRSVLRQEQIDLVRRPTGGRAVLHERERTYAVVGSLRRAPFDVGVVETYRRITEALADALGSLGLEVSPTASGAPERGRPGAEGASCFSESSIHELEVKGRKVVGSAQLRRRHVFLQHGSILMVADAARVARASGGEQPEECIGGLNTLLGRDVGTDEIDRALRAAFEQRFAVEFAEAGLEPSERLRAAQIRCWKHDSAAWTLGGRIGERERRWGPELSGSAPEQDEAGGATV